MSTPSVISRAMHEFRESHAVGIAEFHALPRAEQDAFLRSIVAAARAINEHQAVKKAVQS